MIRRLLAGYLSITTVVLAALGVPLGLLYARNERERLVHDVQVRATEVAAFSAVPLATGDVGSLDEVADAYGRATSGRLVVVVADGRSVADSADRTGRSFASRPEVALALSGQENHGFRRSETLDENLFFVAVPVNSGSNVLGAVRITYPSSFVHERIERSWFVLGAVALLTIAGVAIVSLLVARWVTRPVRELERVAARLGEGDLSARAAVPADPVEVASLARSFNDTAQKLQRLVDAQQGFVADASHQLRTPLAALRLRLENLEAVVGEGARGDVSATLDEVVRLSRIVDGLLVLARADATVSARRTIDVDAVVRGRIDTWAVLAAERDVTLVSTGNAGAALATPDALEQVLDNLIANALDAAPHGSTVTVGLGRGDGWVDVHVVDEGPGMSEDARRDAFTRFLTTSRPGDSTGGFGLGLAIAHRLTTRDGGDVTLDAADGGGLDARVRLVSASVS